MTRECSEGPQKVQDLSPTMPRHASQLVPLPAKEPRRSYHHARRRAPILLAMLIPIAQLGAAVQGAE